MSLILCFDYPGEELETVECADAAAVRAALDERMGGEPEDIEGIHKALNDEGIWHDEGGHVKLFATGGRALSKPFDRVQMIAEEYRREVQAGRVTVPRVIASGVSLVDGQTKQLSDADEYSARECVEYAISCLKNRDSRDCTINWLKRALAQMPGAQDG